MFAALRNPHRELTVSDGLPQESDQNIALSLRFSQ